MYLWNSGSFASSLSSGPWISLSFSQLLEIIGWCLGGSLMCFLDGEAGLVSMKVVLEYIPLCVMWTIWRKWIIEFLTVWSYVIELKLAFCLSGPVCLAQVICILCCKFYWFSFFLIVILHSCKILGELSIYILCTCGVSFVLIKL